MRNIIERAADSGQFDWLQRAVELPAICSTTGI